MAITDELRLFAADPYTGWVPTDKQQADLRAIADRIDAEHESACAEAYGNGVMSVPIALDESAWVELPKDADGVPIRIGERVQRIGNDPSTVSHMSLADDGWRVYVKYDGELGTGSGEPKYIRHYHAPTVEDVLREFASNIADVLGGDDFKLDDNDELYAEYAAKLRLAEEVDA